MQHRYEFLVEALSARARTVEEYRRWQHIINVLSWALPAEWVARAYRKARISA